MSYFLNDTILCKQRFMYCLCLNDPNEKKAKTKVEAIGFLSVFAYLTKRYVLNKHIQFGFS